MKRYIKLKRSELLLFIFAILLASCAVKCGNGKENNSKKIQTHFVKTPSVERSDFITCLNGNKAFDHIKKIVAFGPRHPGTIGIEKTRKYIFDTLKSYGLEPTFHKFTASTPRRGFEHVKMANISVDIAGSKNTAIQKNKIIIGGHFDGKIIDKGFFAGANDGGSSTGLLLEMARCLSKTKAEAPVKIVFFDGEEAFVEWSDSDSLYGSKKMAQILLESNEHKTIAAMINIDMIGDKRLKILRDHQSTNWVFDAILQSAQEQGLSNLFGTQTVSIGDDHIPFLHIGIPAAVLIDLNFGPGWTSNAYWHTDKDTIDKLSPKNLENVGKIVLGAISKIVDHKTKN